MRKTFKPRPGMTGLDSFLKKNNAVFFSFQIVNKIRKYKPDKRSY